MCGPWKCRDEKSAACARESIDSIRAMNTGILWRWDALRIWSSVDGGISCLDILYLDKILLPPDSRRGDKCSIQARKLASWWWIVVLPQIVAKASEVSLNDPRSSETTTSNPRSFGPVSLRRRCQTWGRQRCAEWSKVMARPSGFPGQMRCGTACHWWALRLWKVWHGSWMSSSHPQLVDHFTGEWWKTIAN